MLEPSQPQPPFIPHPTERDFPAGWVKRRVLSSQIPKALVAGLDEDSLVECSQLFSRFGLEIMRVRNGEEAVQAFEDDPSFDIVVLAIHMPGLNGFTTAKLIRRYQIAKRPYIVGVGPSLIHGSSSQTGIDLFVVGSTRGVIPCKR